MAWRPWWSATATGAAEYSTRGLLLPAAPGADSFLGADGVPIEVAKAILGHANVRPEEFDRATERAISMVREAWKQADDGLRERMRVAFMRSSEHEVAFFDQARQNRVEFPTV